MLTHACELDQNHLFEKVIRKCRIWSSKGRVLTICRGNIVLTRWREKAFVTLTCILQIVYKLFLKFKFDGVTFTKTYA